MDVVFRDPNGNTLAEVELTPGEGRPLRAVKARVDDFNDIVVEVEFEEVED